MAATRVIVSASNTITTSLLQKGPLRNSKSFSLCFKNTENRFVSLRKRRLFTCSAIYNPQVQIKEEGQPETLDYRVFFLDNSGKKDHVNNWRTTALVLTTIFFLAAIIWFIGIFLHSVDRFNEESDLPITTDRSNTTPLLSDTTTSQQGTKFEE